VSTLDHAIYDNLRGTECVCGDHKARGNSFCRRHYYELPTPERRALYDRHGYCDHFRKCCDLLGLTPPSTAEVAA
jgi:hypothetical protein